MQTSPVDPQRIEAVVFDVIGTLVDEDETWVRVAARLASETGVAETVDLRASWVDLLDRQMDDVVAGRAQWRPHRELVSDSAQAAVTKSGGTMTRAAADLVSALDSTYPAWPDVASSTAALRRSRLVAALSNGDLDMLARLANANGISWDVALSTGTVGTLKPAASAYRYALDVLDLDPARTLFVAAHPWDLRAAAEHGFRTAFVARPGAERPARGDTFDVEVGDLSALVERLG